MTMNRAFRIISSIILVMVAMTSGYIYGRRGSTPQAVTKPQAPADEYICPMHPFIIKDRTGSCPVCGMELVKKSVGTGITDKELKNISHVALSPTQQIMANLATVAVAVQPFSRNIACTGIVAYNQEKQGKVAAWLGGHIDRLLVKSVGTEVKKGRPVAEIFSLDLYNAEEQYLLAYKTVKLLNSSVSSAFPSNTQMALGEASERLRMLGFKEQQFELLQKSITPAVRVPVYSPISGVVTEKFVQEGQFVNVGDPLFSVADLSNIWVELEVFESDLPLIRVGLEVTMVSPSNPRQTYHGKVKLIYPFLDPKTRTLRLRVEIPNPGLKLKPEMYVTATIKVPMADSLVVPVGAVMDTGKRQVVWVESKPGVFLQRDVKIGARSGKDVQILAGLNAGEKLATTGGYLIDSEAQLSHGLEAPAIPAASAQKKGKLDMDDMEMK